jgi:asparagine synthase (glutamine-hydrolysing)
MCGIFGALGGRGIITDELVSGALNVLQHRGPDGQGRLQISPVNHSGRILRMGHRRLAILDLSEQGRQPMIDRATGNTIVYNGEVYNFKALRDRLAREGATFESQTDTEVVLKWFGRHGLPELLSNIVGMFAFGIWDDERQRLILVRDHTGIKPLYYYQDDSVFLFASEVRALLATGLIRRELDPVALESYLAYGAVQGPHTIINGIRSVPPAHYLIVEADGSFEPPRRYWAPCFVPESQAVPADAGLLRNFRDLLEQVVSEHLSSDVPLGAFLSGGIDSSSVVALMSRVAPDRVHTFSVIFNELSYSEAACSRLMAKQVGSTHEEVCISEETMLGLLPEAIGALDQPSVDGVNVYAISQVARAAGVTVVLSGQGGDELLAGYPRFSWLNKLAKLQTILRFAPDGVLGGAAATASVFETYNRQARKLPDLLRASKSILSSYLVLCQTLPARDRTRLLPLSGHLEEFRFGLPTRLYEELGAAIDGLHVVNKVSYLEIATFLANTLLRDGDSMSMAHSIEVRVPFLDKRVIDFLAPVSGPDKLSRALPKPLLVRALMDLLPEPIYQRPKQGFTFPWDRWLRQRLRQTVGAVLDSRDSGVQLGFVPGECQRIWRTFLSGAGTPWSTVWALFVLISWCVRHEVGYPLMAHAAVGQAD